MHRHARSLLSGVPLLSAVSLLLAAAAPAPALAQSIVWIDPAGSDATGDGSAANPFRSLQKAVDTVSSGGTVMVRPGAYPFATTIANPLTIEAVAAGAVLGPAPAPGAIVAVNGADDVVLRGLRLQGNATQIGLLASGGADRLRLEDCEFAGCGQGGVRASGPANGVRLVGCTFRGIRRPGAAAAVALQACAGAGVEDCAFVASDRGLDLEGCAGAVVRGCTFTDLFQAALVASGSPDLALEDTRFTRCAHLPSPRSWAFPSDAPGAVSLVAFSHRARLSGVIVEQCGGYTGVDTFRPPAARYDGLFALAVEDSKDLLLADSSLLDNRFGGVWLGGQSTGCVLQRCNLVGNGSDNAGPAEDVALHTGGLQVTASEVFWGLPQGPANDGAGPGNGIAGGGTVTFLPPAARPHVTPLLTAAGEPPVRRGFASHAALPLGDTPRAIAVADLDGDGRADLTIAEDAGTLRVLRRTAAGFAPPLVLPVSGRPVAVVAGRFDANAHADLAVLDEQGDRLLLLFGDGAGAFPTTLTVPLARRPLRLVAGDLDGSSGDELVVASQGDLLQAGALQLVRGNGSGGFTVQPLSGTSVPTDVALLDLNADGRLDVVAHDREPAAPGLRLYLNGGGATFGPATSLPLDVHPVVDARLLRVDADGGADDLIVASYAFATPPGTTFVRLFRGTGAGTLLPPVLLHETWGPVELAASGAGPTLHLHVASPAQRRAVDLGPVIAAPSPFVPNAAALVQDALPTALATADVTDDGRPDLLLADAAARELLVLRGEAAFSATRYGSGCPGANGTPAMRHQSLPVLGSRTFALAFEHGRPDSVAYLVLGVQPLDLPLPASPAACRLLVDPLLTVGVTSDTDGFGFVPMPVPIDVALTFGPIFAQWFVLDPEGHALGALSSTEGLRLQIGG